MDISQKVGCWRENTGCWRENTGCWRENTGCWRENKGYRKTENYEQAQKSTDRAYLAQKLFGDLV